MEIQHWYVKFFYNINSLLNITQIENFDYKQKMKDIIGSPSATPQPAQRKQSFEKPKSPTKATGSTTTTTFRYAAEIAEEIVSIF